MRKKHFRPCKNDNTGFGKLQIFPKNNVIFQKNHPGTVYSKMCFFKDFYKMYLTEKDAKGGSKL